MTGYLSRVSLSTTLAICGLLGSSMASAEDIPTIASGSSQLESLVSTLQAADLVDTLAGEGPFTVFAPTNDAFARLDGETVQTLLNEPGRRSLKRILLHHVVPGRFSASDLVGMESVTTAAGTELPLTLIKDRLLVGDAAVSTAGIKADNGIVHIIDRVLIPEAVEAPLTTYLSRAVARGVPLFNDGSPAACSAVYAVALEAVVYSEGWGVDADTRQKLSENMERTERMGDMADRAWAYRRLIDALIEGVDISAISKADGAKTIFDFSDAAQIQSWRTVLDGVMGGLSTGRVEMGDNTLVFSGETSLRNNGGFSSMRVSVPERIFADSDAIRIRVKGDGRTWIIGTKNAAGMGGDSFWTRFETVDGKWQDLVFPIDEMEQHFFGQRRAGKITPQQVRALEFYIYDKESGPFRLELDSLEGVTLSV
jgi:uncharacterized surface protein with fasciclin (FAS1) repeats